MGHQATAEEKPQTLTLCNFHSLNIPQEAENPDLNLLCRPQPSKESVQIQCSGVEQRNSTQLG